MSGFYTPAYRMEPAAYQAADVHAEVEGTRNFTLIGYSGSLDNSSTVVLGQQGRHRLSEKK